MTRRLLACLLVFAASLASAQPLARFSTLGLPAPLTKPRLEGLLQRFVSEQYGKSFQDLGVARDFDHGHLLFDRAGKPVALLYHTQEDTAAQAKGPRSWLQWLATGKVEEAARYARRAYPGTASWHLFVKVKLPEFLRRGTVTDQMLDPALIDVDPALSRQYTFTRTGCGNAPSDSNLLEERLPSGAPVCLELAAD